MLNGGRQSLRLALNILSKSWCGGCNYHEYPYDATPPLSGSHVQTFESDEDVWSIIDLLIEEVRNYNNEGKSFDVAMSIDAQLPFFSCKNVIYSKEYNKDIERYIYCQEFNIAPYPGSYGEQPCLWVEKAFIIKNTLAKVEKNRIDNARTKHND